MSVASRADNFGTGGRNLLARSSSVRVYSLLAGALLLVNFVAGGFGEGYAPSQLIVAGNAATTAHNVITSDLLLRLGFVGYLGEAITDVALAFLLYVLLRPVQANLAFLAVMFRLMATATFAFAELFYFAPSLILRGNEYLTAFSTDQLHSLALLSFNVYAAGASLFNVHYGIASMILGYLMFRSGFLPRVVGALWVLAGLGFVIGTLLWIFTPTVASLFLLPQIAAVLPLALWLLVRGVDAEKWNQAAAAAA